MKLLHIIGSMNPDKGGVCQTIRNSVPPFLEQGHQAEVLCLDDPRAEFLARDKFTVHALGQGRGAWNFHPALLPWLKEHLRSYDVVILNGLWQYQCYALWQAARQTKSRYFVFPHGMLDPWFQKLSIRPVKAVRNWLVWKWIQHRIVNQAAGLLFTCEEERRLARLPFKPYRPRREAVVGLGVPPPPAYAPAMQAAFAEKCPGLKDAPYLLFLGRIHEKKGVDALLQAYAAQSRVQSQALPKLVVAGPDLDSPYGRRMQQLAAAACPPDSVYWPGMLTGDSKWGALYHCEASILPSHQENFGISVVESLACGRPVLMSDQVNIWREIKDASAAFVQPDTIAGTRQLLAEWLALPAQARSLMAARARACFENYFSIHSATQKLMATIAP